MDANQFVKTSQICRSMDLTVTQYSCTCEKCKEIKRCKHCKTVKLVQRRIYSGICVKCERDINRKEKLYPR